MKINRNVLKRLGLLSMLADHIGLVFFPPGEPVYIMLRTVGRLAAPAMCFLLAEGYVHTSSAEKYMKRMLLFALLSQLPFRLICEKYSLQEGFTGNMLFTLFLSLAILEICSRSAPSGSRDFLVFLLLGASAFCDWGVTAPLWVLCFFVFRREPVRRMQAFAAVCAGSLILDGVSAISRGLPPSRWVWQAGIFLFLPLMRLYTDEEVHSSKASRLFFYLFYPAHMLALYGLSVFFTS